MLQVKIDLPGTICLGRVFFRDPGAFHSDFSQLFESDFERRRKRSTAQWHESGISLLRLDLLSDQQAIEYVKSKMSTTRRAVIRTGVCLALADDLRRLSYTFLSESINSVHVSLRCGVCDLSIDCSSPFCGPPEHHCSFDRLNSFASIQKLAEVFKVSTPA